MPQEPRWARDGPSRRAPGMAMERTHPERSAGPHAGARPFGSFWGDCQKEPAQQGGTNAPSNSSISSSTIHSQAKPPESHTEVLAYECNAETDTRRPAAYEEDS